MIWGDIYIYIYIYIYMYIGYYDKKSKNKKTETKNKLTNVIYPEWGDNTTSTKNIIFLLFIY